MKPTSFYYICPIDNLISILTHGILSRQKAMEMQVQRTDIHDDTVLALRDKVLPNTDKKLYDFVNLYFQPRNAMMYRLTCNFGRKKLAILQVKPHFIGRDNVYFTDRNAATHGAKFYSQESDLKHIDKGVLSKEYWTDSDETKQRMMAELLVPDHIPIEDILSVMVLDKKYLSGDMITQLQAHKIEIVSEPYSFFSPIFREKIMENISLSQGDMFFSAMQTFTISVNTIGVMGKGLASRTKYQFPDAYVRYQDDCKSGKLKVGKPTLFKRGIRIEEELADERYLLDPDSQNGTRWFLFLPTKRHWRDKSRFEDIELSMQWLCKNYQKQGIQSIALPALGCGLGQLSWRQVGPMMCYYLKQIAIQSVIYLPMDFRSQPLEDTDWGFLLSYRPKLVRSEKN